MKCLTIREPYASLIMANLKNIETRSWKTNYRGKLYIHAGLSPVKKLPNNNLKKLTNNIYYHYGEIICQCFLADVIYISKEFIWDLKKNNYQEYICGDYQIGRYAWILKNIQVLDKPLKVKGKLSIWNYNPEDANKN